MRYPRISDKDLSEIISLHISGLCYSEIARITGYHRGFIPKALKRAGVNRGGTPKNVWDEDFFNRNNAIVAYWAGFIYADGTLGKRSSNSYRMTISINDQDAKHLMRFCVDVGLSSGIRFSDYVTLVNKLKRRHAIASISSECLARDLYRWGIVERKTYIWVEPIIPEELIRHFLRGWIDGDGHVKGGRGCGYIVGLTNKNTAPLEWFIEKLESGIGFKLQHVKYVERVVGNGSSCSVLISHKRDTISVAHYLCDGSDLFLERKWHDILLANPYTERTLFVGEKNGNSKLKNGEVEQIYREYHGKLLNQVELAKKYSVTQSTISWIVRGRNALTRKTHNEKNISCDIRY